MKLAVFVAAVVGVVAVNAQTASPNYPADMPSCGRTCGDNMFGQATSPAIGCDSQTDYTCLCNEPNFLYGVRDCSSQTCQDIDDANAAVAWGNDFCASYSGTVSVATETSNSTATATTATSTPTATTTTVETTTSDSSTFETTVVSTLYGAVGATTIVSTGTSDGSSFTTTLSTSTYTSESPSSAVTETTTSSSSEGAAPHMTAGPMAGLIAAGLAAALL